MNIKKLLIVILAVAIFLSGGIVIYKIIWIVPSGQKPEQNIKEKLAIYNIDNISVADLNAANLAAYKTKFSEYKMKLMEAITIYEAGGKLEKDKPETDYFIELARYANYLGKKDWAKEILSGYFNYYDVSSVVWNNLAAIYEEERNYLKANEYYLKILDTFTDKAIWGLYYNIAKNYKLLGDKEKTREYYEKYKAKGGSDGELEEYLSK